MPTLHYSGAPRTLSAMARQKGLEALVEGHATSEGTRHFQERFVDAQTDHFYRPINGGNLVSSLGLGTYLGDCDDSEDARYTATARAALERGVNLLDTAINYRCQRSERAIGQAVRISIANGSIRREEVVVCTKGGYIPLDRTPPATKEGYRGFLDSEYYRPGVMQPADVVSGGHCLAPRYLDLTVMRDAFTALENQVSRGVIGSYGCATWNGLRVPPETRSHLSLEELVTMARDVAGANHHFRVVQLPINLAMTEAVRVSTQCVRNDRVPLLEAANRLGISVVGSATLMQSQLTRALPEQVHSAFPGFETDARRAIAFSQSLPLVSALVGMKSVSHLDENLAPPKIG